MELKDILKELRNKKGLTQEAMANELGISYRTYTSYEKGIRNPSKENLKKIAETHNISLTNLIAYQTDKLLIDDVFETEIVYRNFNKIRRKFRNVDLVPEKDVKNILLTTLQEFSFEDYGYIKDLLLQVSFFIRDRMVLNDINRYDAETMHKFITLLNVLNNEGLNKIADIGNDLSYVEYLNSNKK